MKIDPIIVRGARQHNLKNISLDIPSQKIVVITGPSGSGKSSLAFDTLFSEGQRRYVESLSSYARQFLEQLSKPDVDFVDGLSPAIAIDQKTISSHPRSTVGTVTSIYDFLRLLYARMGEVKDPDTGENLRAHTDDEIINHVKNMGPTARVRLFAQVVRGKKGEFLREFEKWRRAGFSKIIIDAKEYSLFDPILISKHQNHDIDLLIDSIKINQEDADQRIRDALKVADDQAEGWLRCYNLDTKESSVFSRKISSSSGQSFPELEPRLFSFNSPYGMCLQCKGLGLVEIEKKSLRDSLDDDDDELFQSELDSYKECPACKGTRLRAEALNVFFHEKNISELCRLSCQQLKDFFETLPDPLRKHPVVNRLLPEVLDRLKFLINVGVGYLSLERRSGTLSGGEAQRIRLATQLGSELCGVMYVLDEPSIGLHPRDHEKLLNSLKKLRDLGNSVIIVEHDEETIRMADYLIDIGPGAGIHGGQLIAHGTLKDLEKDKNSTTCKYLRGELQVSEARARRRGNGHHLELLGCQGHNLKKVNVKIPLGKLIVFTGVSGSGKSSLVTDTLEAAISQKLYRSSHEPLSYKELRGLEHIDKMVHVDQRSIGRSPRSNPATYTGLFSQLRTLFAQLPEAQIRGYSAGTFSFNVKGGRCDSCEGAGRIKIEMHFLPDSFVPCEQCNGKRYRREVLEVKFKGKSISDVLALSIEEAYELFKNQPLIESKLKTLLDVGLGYIKLGQPSTTLSGGEAQRIKLAKELSKRSTGKTIYFLDEPTTGLHFQDIKKLMELLQQLCDLGNTVVIIEHNLDVVSAADWIIDVGPDAGHKGGEIVFEGTPEELSKKPKVSPTGHFMADFFKRKKWN